MGRGELTLEAAPTGVDFHLVPLQLGHLRVSLCQVVLQLSDVGLSVHLLSENGPSGGMSRPRPGPPCFPAGLPSCSLPGHLPHPFRTPSSQQLTIFHQHKPRAFALAHSPSLVSPAHTVRKCCIRAGVSGKTGTTVVPRECLQFGETCWLGPGPPKPLPCSPLEPPTSLEPLTSLTSHKDSSCGRHWVNAC